MSSPRSSRFAHLSIRHAEEEEGNPSRSLRKGPRRRRGGAQPRAREVVERERERERAVEYYKSPACRRLGGEGRREPPVPGARERTR